MIRLDLMTASVETVLALTFAFRSTIWRPATGATIFVAVQTV